MHVTVHWLLPITIGIRMKCLAQSCTILGERMSIGLDLRECLDIWMELVITFGLSRSLPSLSKSSKTLGSTPSVVVGFVHVILIII